MLRPHGRLYAAVPWTLSGLGASGAQATVAGVDSGKTDAIAEFTQSLVAAGWRDVVVEIVKCMVESGRADAVAQVTRAMLSQGGSACVIDINNGLLAKGCVALLNRGFQAPAVRSHRCQHRDVRHRFRSYYIGRYGAIGASVGSELLSQGATDFAALLLGDAKEAKEEENAVDAEVKALNKHANGNQPTLMESVQETVASILPISSAASEKEPQQEGLASS